MDFLREMDEESTKGIEVTVMLESGEIVPMQFWRKACVGDLRVALKSKVAQFEHIELADIVVYVNSTTELSGRDRLSQFQSRLLHPKIKIRRDEDLWDPLSSKLTSSVLYFCLYNEQYFCDTCCRSGFFRDTCLAPLATFFQATDY